MYTFLRVPKNKNTPEKVNAKRVLKNLRIKEEFFSENDVMSDHLVKIW